MSIYLGTFGDVELQREFDGSELESIINVSDVNASSRRFSFDFEHGQLISGDQIEITSTDGSALDFIQEGVGSSATAYTKPSITRFVYVDELDGIRLYSNFAAAVNGLNDNPSHSAFSAQRLRAPSSAIPIKVKVQNSDLRLLAQCNGYELNTERETVDTTVLSDEFRSRISTLMSGSGKMSCFWEYLPDGSNELPMYLLELQLRTRVGSQFKARFYLKRSDHNPSGVSTAANDEIWYEFNGVLTNCAVQFSPTNSVQIEADFITTGPIEIRVDLSVDRHLLQEQGTSSSQDKIRLEQATSSAGDFLMLESSD